jgi:Tol biopolymer transport system component
VRVLLLLTRCLQKDRTKRLRDVGDAVLEIDTEEASSLNKPAGKRQSKISLPWLIAAAALVAAAAIWITSRNPGAPPQKALRFAVPPPGQFFVRGSTAQFAISPDGRSLVFVAEEGTRKFVDTSSGLYGGQGLSPARKMGSMPFWSADSKYIGFWRNQQIHKLAIADGHSEVVSSAAGFPIATWSSNGVIVFSGDGTIFRVSASGGTPEAFIAPDTSRKETAGRTTSISPGWRSLSVHGCKR